MKKSLTVIVFNLIFIPNTKFTKEITNKLNVISNIIHDIFLIIELAEFLDSSSLFLYTL
ncbi:hypothetical protein [Myroides sp. N17-2]|uniref:hypothetical protein n=1 Tax=Myroides sp. N17-2 TaxID=2030799 RepID=UPI0013042A1A|nr:hypothetical protein [Myroides sp. N17-2]